MIKTLIRISIVYLVLAIPPSYADDEVFARQGDQVITQYTQALAISVRKP